MLKNYFKTVLRQISKNKLFSFINIFGLALGMAACFVIAQYVSYHTSFDQFHQNADRIVRLQSTTYKNGEEQGKQATTPAPLTDRLLAESPNIEAITRFYPFNYANSRLIYSGENALINEEQKGIYATEKSFFELFDINFIAGSAKDFGSPNKAIMTKENVLRYFDDPQKAIGETFKLSGNTGTYNYELIGVVDHLPINSHFDFSLLLSYVSIDDFTEARTDWAYNTMFSYILLKNQNDTPKVLSQVNDIWKRDGNDFYESRGYTFDFYLQPLEKIHIGGSEIGDFTIGIDQTTILALSIVAVTILFIAWINYMNLSLVRTLERLKEMGIRMCMGSSKAQITTLFIMEALVMNLIGFSLALGITQVMQGYIQELTGIQISLLFDPRLILFMIGLIGLGTVIIGFYPYLLLKTVRAVNVLTGSKVKVGKLGLRKGLVFAQFMITFFLIAGTYTVYKQISYMKNADLKIDIENILVIKSPPGDISSDERQNAQLFKTLKQELISYSEITEIAQGGAIPGEFIGWGTLLGLKNTLGKDQVQSRLIAMDYNYPQFFDIDLVAGRNLKSSDDPWSKGDVVINEKLAEMLGFDNPEEAIGADIDGFYAPLQVRGVLENHHHTSLHGDFEPIAFIISGWTEYYFIKLQMDTDEKNRAAQLKSTIATIEGEWDELYKDYQMDYFFLDNYFNQQYVADERFGKLFTGFSTLAIVIACLGLFGLTSFTIQQRTKEIGIRKVLGAGISSLTVLLSKEYIILVMIACMVTLPLAWVAMNAWLKDYSFRIEIGWWFYIVPIALILLLALLSIIFKVFSTVMKNPVESLRYE